MTRGGFGVTVLDLKSRPRSKPPTQTWASVVSRMLTSDSNASGWRQSSASTNPIYFPRERLMPVLRAFDTPPWPGFTSLKRWSDLHTDSVMANELSVEPSSTTVISKSPKVCSCMDAAWLVPCMQVELDPISKKRLGKPFYYRIGFENQRGCCKFAVNL